MKIIHNLHFIDGGPVCPECKGTKLTKISGGGAYDEGYEDAEGNWIEVEPVPCWEKEVPCPDCYETGVIPVEDTGRWEFRGWSADECAEWLWVKGYWWYPEANNYEDVEMGQVERVLLTIEKNENGIPRIITCHIKGWKLWGLFEGKDLTAALRNAVIAVEEREERLEKEKIEKGEIND